MNNRIAALRLENHRITQSGPRRPADLVGWLGAVQAQEYAAAKWALALRMPDGTTDAQIERALNDGRILRTHVLRPTWHFVAASDVHWMLELTAPRVQRAMAYGYRHLELDAAVRTRAARVFERALSRDECLTRADLGVQLARSRLAAKGIRLALLTVHAELEGVICSGPRSGRQPTYALLARRAPRARRLSRDEALAELTTRYFRSHGPATIRDFVWWSGLMTADAKRGLEIIRGRPEVIDDLTYWTLRRSPGSPASGTTSGSVHLLPIYDEYLVAYRDHDAVPRKAAFFGILPQAVIAQGQVAGTWKVDLKGDGAVVRVTTQRRLTGLERRGLGEAAARYGRFLQTPVAVSM